MVCNVVHQYCVCSRTAAPRCCCGSCSPISRGRANPESPAIHAHSFHGDVCPQHMHRQPQFQPCYSIKYKTNGARCSAQVRRMPHPVPPHSDVHRHPSSTPSATNAAATALTRTPMEADPVAKPPQRAPCSRGGHKHARRSRQRRYANDALGH